MKGSFINYYFMKDCIKEIPNAVKDVFPKENSIYFNMANFSTVSIYSFIYNPFKKDKYELDLKLRSSYLNFIVECAILLKSSMEENDSYFIESLLFLYGLITTNTLSDYLYPYLKGIKKDALNLDSALNILDTYMAKKNKIDLTKESLYSLFPNAYTYYDSIEQLIRNPMVKCYRFMGTNTYYKKSYKRFNKFAKHSKDQSRLWDYKLFDNLFRRKKNKKIYLIYTKDEDSTLLNLKKEAYIVNGIEKHESFEQLLKLAKDKAIKRIEALNNYLFIPKGEQEFREEFHIDKLKKL